MVLSNQNGSETNGTDTIVLNGRSDEVICKYCGKPYMSMGNDDPGYCRNCGLIFLSGPLDGKKVGEFRDNSRSETETG